VRPLSSKIRRPHPLAGWSKARQRLLAGPLAVLGLGVVAFSLFAGFGGVSSGQQTAVSTSPSVIFAGEQLYNIHCSSGHGVAGQGSSRAPSIIFEGAAGVDFYLTTGRMPLNNPHDQAIRHHPFFNAGQIRSLVSYAADLPKLNHLSGSGIAIPSVLPLCSGTMASNTAKIAMEQKQGTAKCVTLSFGQQAFSLNCSGCHQIAGRGGLLAKGNVIPSLQNANIIQAAEAMRIGPIPMPRFGPGQLTEVQISAIAHFVEYLQRPDQRGGLKIGLLLFVSRLMGTRG
jgi:ubiquinol-cytochrome c reductase cytochrome c subunit